jgi:hypothetical protein
MSAEQVHFVVEDRGRHSGSAEGIGVRSAHVFVEGS